ncbi:MAG: acyl dehydratase, partial [Pseudomonadota bacterium]|nr:acyl dehydratase [Pseudomonadota bacterium]
MGSPGVDKLRWKRPVKAGDTLYVQANVIELSPSQKEDGRDGVRIRYDTFNQNEEIVMTLTSLHFVRRQASKQDR